MNTKNPVFSVPLFYKFVNHKNNSSKPISPLFTRKQKKKKKVMTFIQTLFSTSLLTTPPREVHHQIQNPSFKTQQKFFFFLCKSETILPIEAIPSLYKSLAGTKSLIITPDSGVNRLKKEKEKKKGKKN